MKKKNSISSSPARKLLVAVLAVQMVCLNLSPAWAQFPDPVDLTDINVLGQTMTIGSSRVGGTIEYNVFNIGSEWSVVFNDAASDVTVNRINAAGGRSEIYGSLRANGTIYLLNQAGILFGSGARVNVGGLVASAMGHVEDRGADGWIFSDPGQGDITVESGASINAGDFAYLVGRSVNVAGTLNAGDILLGAYGGSTTTNILLSTSGGGSIRLELGSGWISTNGGGGISISNAFSTGDAVDTNGTILVGNSNILLSAAGDITQTSRWSAGSASNITLQAAQNIVLDGLEAGEASVTFTAGGDVTQQSSAGNAIHLDDLTLDVDGNVTLDDNANDFDRIEGTAANLTVNDANRLDLAGVDVGAGELDITAGGSLTDSADNTAGAVTLMVGVGATLNNSNDFDRIAGITPYLTVVDVDDLDLAGLQTDDRGITVTTGGNLTDSAANVGMMTLNVAGSAVLDDAGNDFIGIRGTVTNLTVHDVNNLDLAGVNGETGTLNITVGGNLTDSAANTAGRVNLAVAGDVILNVTNRFGSIAGTAAYLRVVDDNRLDLAGVDAGTGTLDVTADSLTDSATNTAGAVVLDVAGDATLDVAGNDFDSIAGTATNLTVSDIDDLELAGVDVGTGTLDVTAGSLTDSATNTAGSLAFLAQSGSAILDDANAFGTVAGTAEGNITLVNTQAMTIGAVHGQTGLTANGPGARIDVSVTGGTLTVAEDVATIGGPGGRVVTEGGVVVASGAAISSGAGNIVLRDDGESPSPPNPTPQPIPPSPPNPTPQPAPSVPPVPPVPPEPWSEGDALRKIASASAFLKDIPELIPMPGVFQDVYFLANDTVLEYGPSFKGTAHLPFTSGTLGMHDDPTTVRIFKKWGVCPLLQDEAMP